MKPKKTNENPVLDNLKPKWVIFSRAEILFYSNLSDLKEITSICRASKRDYKVFELKRIKI